MMGDAGMTEKEGLSTKFKVHITSAERRSSRTSDGILFQSCDGLQSEMEVTYLPSGNYLNMLHAVRGSRRSGQISFSKGVVDTSGSPSKEIHDWFQDVLDSGKPLKRKTLNILLLDSKNQDKVIAQWEVRGAWPCRWAGPLLSIDSNQPTVESVSFAYEQLSRLS